MCAHVLKPPLDPCGTSLCIGVNLGSLSGPEQDVTVWETLAYLICEAVKLLDGPGKEVEQTEDRAWSVDISGREEVGRYEPRNREFDSQRLGKAKQIEEEYRYWP